MPQVKFIKKSQFGAEGEERFVTERAKDQFQKLGIIEKELKEEIETTEEKEVFEKKELKEETKGKKVKVTKAPKL